MESVAFYFADLYAKLRSRHAGSVLGLIRTMIARTHVGAPATAATWQAVLREQVGSWALTDWQRMMQGALIRPAPGAFGRCLVAEPIETGWFDLGFGGSTHLVSGTVITELDATSNAARAGLRDGDVLTAGSAGLAVLNCRAIETVDQRLTDDGVMHAPTNRTF